MWFQNTISVILSPEMCADFDQHDWEKYNREIEHVAHQTSQRGIPEYLQKQLWVTNGVDADPICWLLLNLGGHVNVQICMETSVMVIRAAANEYPESWGLLALQVGGTTHFLVNKFMMVYGVVSGCVV